MLLYSTAPQTWGLKRSESALRRGTVAGLGEARESQQQIAPGSFASEAVLSAFARCVRQSVAILSQCPRNLMSLLRSCCYEEHEAAGDAGEGPRFTFG